MKDEKAKIYERLIEIAKEFEKFGLGCIVMDNRRRAESKNDVGNCFIITQPILGNELSNELSESEFMSLFKEAENYCKNLIKNDFILLCLGPIWLVDSTEKWFNFLDDFKKHPILQGIPYGSTDIFLSKVIYGQELHEIIIRAFQNKYGENFIQECNRVWEEECKRRGENNDIFCAEFKKEVEERKKPFNGYEKEEISEFLIRCLEFSKKNEIAAIVGIDCSGRPLAQMLFSLLEKTGYRLLPVLDFLDPHRLIQAMYWETGNSLKIPADFEGKFIEEFPEIFQLLQKDPRKVLFIDDQVYSYFNTIKAIRQLVKQAVQKEEIVLSFEVVSGFNGYNGFTWWKNKRLLRIKSNKDSKKITLRSVPRKINKREEKKIDDFEKKLSEIIEEIVVVWETPKENCLAAL